MVKLAAFLLGALLLEALGVVSLGHGLKQIGEMRHYSLGEAARLVGRGLTNPFILLGTAFEAVFFVMLLVLLKRHDVSLIWPLTSLGFVLTTLAARFLRHEEVSALRWAGVMLIVLGAGLVGWSERNKKTSPAAPATLATVAGMNPDPIVPRDEVSGGRH